MEKPTIRFYSHWMPALGVAILVATTLIGGLALYFVEARLVTSAGEGLALATADIADKLDMQMAERYGDIQLLSRALVFQGRDHTAMKQRLLDLLATYPVYRWAGVTDINGRVMAATDSTSKGLDLSHEPGFLAVREGQRAMIQDAAPDAEGVLAVTFVSPLHDARGTFIGTVISRVGLPVLEDVFARSVNALRAQWGMEARIEYVFLDHAGNVFVDSVLGEAGRINLKRQGVLSAQLLDAGEAGFIEERHARRQVEVVTGYAQTKGMKHLTGLQWGVLVRIDRSDILVPIRATMWKIGAAGAGIVLPLFGLAIWSIRNLMYSWNEADESRIKAQASENRFHLLMEHAPAAILLTDAAGTIVLANRRVDEMFGYPPGQLIGQPIEILVPEAVRDRHRAHRARYLESPQARPMGANADIAGRRQDGTEFPIRAGLSHLKAEDGTFAVAILQDISREKMEEIERERLGRDVCLILDSVVGGLCGVDRQGRCTFINQAGAALLGYHPDELLQRNLHELIHHTSADGSPCLGGACRIYQACQVEVACEMDDEVLWRRDGSSFPAEIGSRPMYENGVVTGAVLTFADITVRKQAEEALRDKDHRIRLAIKATEVGIWEWNTLTNRVRWDHQMFHLYGIPATTDGLVDFTDWSGAVIPEDLPEQEAILQDTVRRKGQSTREFRIRRRSDGALRTIQAVEAVRTDTLGRAEWVVGTNLDITERKQAEEALHDGEERLRVIIDTALDAVITMDRDGKVMEWNRQAETSFGWTRQEALGQVLSQLIVPPQHREAHTRGVLRYLADGVGPVLNTRIEITALHKNGAEFPVELAVTPCQVGNTVCFSAFIRDIRPRKESEQALVTYARELEQMNQSLDDALNDAEVSTQAKSAFLATMSHEIRTPMNGVIGMTGLLLDTALTPEQREFAEIVRSSGEHLLTVINDILDFSKIEAGKLTLELLDFDLRTAVAETLELVAERAFGQGVNLACLVHADVPAVLHGDPGRLRQILLNLVSNAIKFTAQGEVVVSVTLAHQTETEATVRVAVQDTGIGLATEAQGRLFQSFSQADSSTTRKYGGTGLGLAICKQLTELMGGQIGIDSRVGEGSTFWFTVPLGRALQGAVSTPPLATQDLRGRRLCIVDGHPTNRRILEHYAERWGVRCLPAEDGTKALACLREAAAQGQACDFAIIDMQMPGMDGLELARAIQADPALAPTRLVLLTSQGQRGDAAAAQAAGYGAYLTKPVREAYLYASLATLCARAAEVPASRPALVTRHSLAEAAARATARVLVAEDNIVNQKVAVRMLEKLGYRVDLAANGLEVLDAVARLSYAAVVMDCQMPEMDGFAATAEIRKREALSVKREAQDEIRTTLHEIRFTNDAPPRRIPIIAMTANAQAEDRARCLAAGMDDYVSKPVNPEALAEVLARWVTAPGSSAHSTEGRPLQTVSKETALDRS